MNNIEVLPCILYTCRPITLSQRLDLNKHNKIMMEIHLRIPLLKNHYPRTRSRLIGIPCIHISTFSFVADCVCLKCRCV